MADLRVVDPATPSTLDGLVEDYLASCRARGLSPKTIRDNYGCSRSSATCSGWSRSWGPISPRRREYAGRAPLRTDAPWLLARRAELHAKEGSDSAAMRDLDSAERALDGPEDWWSMSPCGMVELAAYRGAVLATLGRHQEAADTLAWVLDRMDPANVMWRAAVAADRDAALARL